MLFLLLAGTAGGIAGDNSTLRLLEISLIWGQYAKNRFLARWLKNERVVDQTTRVSNLTVFGIKLRSTTYPAFSKLNPSKMALDARLPGWNIFGQLEDVTHWFARNCASTV